MPTGKMDMRILQTQTGKEEKKNNLRGVEFNIQLIGLQHDCFFRGCTDFLCVCAIKLHLAP